MSEIILLKYQDDFDEEEILDAKIYKSPAHIRSHLLDKHGGEINDFEVTLMQHKLNENEISVITFCVTDKTDESFDVYAIFKDITR